MKSKYHGQSIFFVLPFILMSGCGKPSTASFQSKAVVNDEAQTQYSETANQEKIEGGAFAEADSTQILPQVQSGGLPYGHFDLDTSKDTYDFNAGTTYAHFHEYDDAFNVTGVDFFNLLDPKMISPSDVVDKDQSFKIIIANAQLSPGARIIINGQTILATDWQKKGLSKDLPVFSFSGANGTNKLAALAISFDPKISISSQLIPSETSLVRSNVPGPGGSYRAGALTIQMIDSKKGQIDASLGVAKVGAAGMLWEATLFWHKK